MIGTPFFFMKKAAQNLRSQNENKCLSKPKN